MMFKNFVKYNMQKCLQMKEKVWNRKNEVCKKSVHCVLHILSGSQIYLFNFKPLSTCNNSSENVVCLSHLLHIFANIFD